MKKLIILFILVLSSLNFSANINNTKWYSFLTLVVNYDKLKSYDIIVLEKGNKFTQQWGHCYILNEDLKLIEFKSYFEYYTDNPIYSFINEKRKIAILRYSNLNKDTQLKLRNNLDKYYNKRYNVFTDNSSENIDTYFSKFIYTLYKEVGIELGKNKWPILPYDFLNSPLLENVILEGE